ncbi:MAG: ATP-binding cassette domain-containing protein [Euryarchaeota archaeon]|nr:ATP-binding cassette domain-containing protein [Euryarchaeota archaeon]
MTNDGGTAATGRAGGAAPEHSISLKDVKKEYRVKGRKVPVKALTGATMAVEKGAMVAVKGESGSGKTTLLQMIGALDSATSGEVVVGGKDLRRMNEGQLTRHRAETIGFVFQSFNLIPNLTSLENVELPMEALDVPKGDRRKRAVELLESVGMKERMDYKPLKLSGGEQQRVAIARALANNPSIILADEPTGSLDSKTGMSIIQLLDKLRREKGTTVVIVTHSDRAAKLCDFTFNIRDGIITSKTNLALEEDSRLRKEKIRAGLAVSGKVTNQLFHAEFDTLAKIAEASIQELTEATGDDRTAKRVSKKAQFLLEREMDSQKELLAIDLNIEKGAVDKLFADGLHSVQSIKGAGAKRLAKILGDERLANEVAERAELQIAKESE